MNNVSQLIAITCADGSLSLMQFLIVGRGSVLPSGAHWINPEGGWWSRPATDEAVASEVAKACASWPAAQSWRKIAEANLPQTGRTYRNAWRDTGAAIVHDMVKAREIHLFHLRRARKVKFIELDAEWMKATGQHDVPQANAIEAKRQLLRDLPDCSAAATIEALKAIALPEV